MPEPLFVKNTITIDAPASKVWDVLTKPEQTKKYMFGCETVSDWKQGISLVWRGEYEGKVMDFGTLLTVTQGDYSKVANGEGRYKEAYNNGEGWNPILVEIKKVTEE